MRKFVGWLNRAFPNASRPALKNFRSTVTTTKNYQLTLPSERHEEHLQIFDREKHFNTITGWLTSHGILKEESLNYVKIAHMRYVVKGVTVNMDIIENVIAVSTESKIIFNEIADFVSKENEV